MSIAELKSELDQLSPQEVKELSDYLSIKAKLQDEKFMAELGRKIDDKDSANWLSAEEAEKRLFPNS